MYRTVEFGIYLVGIALISYYYPALKQGVDMLALIPIVGFYAYGVASFSTWLRRRLEGKKGKSADPLDIPPS